MKIKRKEPLPSTPLQVDPPLDNTEEAPVATADESHTADKGSTLTGSARQHNGSTTLGKGDMLHDRYMLVEILGSEGISTVYKAIDRKKSNANKGRYVTIKVLKKQYESTLEWVVALAQAARKCQNLDHPNIAKMHGFHRDGTTIYLLMEYLPGESLGQKIRWGVKRMPVKQALSVVNDIGNAIAYAHERGIVHGDLNPANVFVTDSGHVKVIDFGIAQALRRSAKDDADAPHFGPDNYSLATPSYASPEMLDLKEPDPRDDVYALACIAFELMAGRHPFGRVRATGARDHGLELRPSQAFTAAQWSSLQQALAFDLDQRTPTVTKFLADFNAPTKWIRWASIAAGVVAVSVAAGLFIDRSQEWSADSETVATPTLAGNSDSNQPVISGAPDPKSGAMVDLATEASPSVNDQTIPGQDKIISGDEPSAAGLTQLTGQETRTNMLSSLAKGDALSPADIEITTAGPVAETNGSDAREPARSERDAPVYVDAEPDPDPNTARFGVEMSEPAIDKPLGMQLPFAGLVEGDMPAAFDAELELQTLQSGVEMREPTIDEPFGTQPPVAGPAEGDTPAVVDVELDPQTAQASVEMSEPPTNEPLGMQPPVAGSAEGDTPAVVGVEIDPQTAQSGVEMSEPPTNEPSVMQPPVAGPAEGDMPAAVDVELDSQTAQSGVEMSEPVTDEPSGMQPSVAGSAEGDTPAVVDVELDSQTAQSGVEMSEPVTDEPSGMQPSVAGPAEGDTPAAVDVEVDRQMARSGVETSEPVSDEPLGTQPPVAGLAEGDTPAVVDAELEPQTAQSGVEMSEPATDEPLGTQPPVAGPAEDDTPAAVDVELDRQTAQPGVEMSEPVTDAPLGMKAPVAGPAEGDMTAAVQAGPEIQGAESGADTIKSAESTLVQPIVETPALGDVNSAATVEVKPEIHTAQSGADTIKDERDGTTRGQPAGTGISTAAQPQEPDVENDEFAAITEVLPGALTGKTLSGTVKSKTPDVSSQRPEKERMPAAIEPQARVERSPERQVAALLDLAESQISARRLSTPAGNNALQTYREVMRLEPENEGAKQGIEKIKRQYSVWAQAARNRGDWESAKSYVRRAVAIDPNHSAALMETLRELEEASRAQQETKRLTEQAAMKIAKARTPDPMRAPVAATQGPSVVINEFMASNAQTIADAQGGYDDWIELYNKSQAVIDLSGYYLSDDPRKLKKWRFPDGTSIGANSYLVVWADRSSSYTDITAQPPRLHANFELSRRGEEILLVDTDENGNAIIDRIAYGRQREDRSVGRSPNGFGEFGTARAPTPGRANVNR